MREKSFNIYHKRLIKIYMFCLILAIIPLIIFTQINVKPKNLEEANKQTLNLVESKANEIGSWLEQRISEIRIIDSLFSVPEMDFEQIKPYLSVINGLVADTYGNLEETTYAIGKTDGLGWINDNLTIDVSQRDYFIEAMNTEDEYVIGNPVVSKADNEPIFLICYPIRNELKETIGFINGSINLQHFSDITEEIDIYDGTAWIMNKNAEVYTHKERIVHVFSEHLETIASLAKNENGSINIEVGGRSMTVFYSSIPYAENWILCDAIYTENLTSSTSKIVNSLLLCALIDTFLIWLASFLFSKELAVENLHLIDEVSLIYERERKAEIRALQAQINPHFLYNTLDTIQWKALDYNAYEIAEMIQKLSQVFRISLSDGKEYIPLEQEIKHVQSYLDIQKIRYKDQFDYTLTMDKDAESLIVPKLIIQPLVENSIYHGIKGMEEKGIIDISIQLVDEQIVIEVKDNGRGMDKKALEHLKSDLTSHAETDHYGLHNIYEKLHLTYGRRFSFDFNSNHGFSVKITLPFTIGDEE